MPEKQRNNKGSGSIGMQNRKRPRSVGRMKNGHGKNRCNELERSALKTENCGGFYGSNDS